ncbi:uncharacterized protein V6R79_008893 [Siganus canaliculatus]
MRNSSWICVFGLLAALGCVQATYTYHSVLRCSCNGRSRYCLRDARGLHCVDCQGDTEGRHCERCKAGFYLQGAGPSCTPCRCNATGSLAATCDSRGRCRCKDGVTGDKCDRCPDGAIGPQGCSQRRQPREDSGSRSSCFCYGHSSQCSPQSGFSGFSVYTVTSTFTDGVDGWTPTAPDVNPRDVHFRWSPKHQDVEVISKSSLPVYLSAPAPYLGNQLLSYGQNFSFSLRLDRGVRHPSISDVILEGGGLKVSASLGDLRTIVPCGQKLRYSFRLDQQPSSRWRPQLSSSQFQTLLQNLTAIRIRATFGENGRGYLDNVQLVSARRGPGTPARWVQTCSCPPGYEGDFCERCAAGFKRRSPADGAFSACESCSCRGGSCDPQTGDCYSADETTGDLSCPAGSYRDPWQPQSCSKCPCPEGTSCSVSASTLRPQCDPCPAGTTGPRCDVCQEGFYGDPAGLSGVQRPCRPCRCNGHIDVGVAGSCDRSSGECLRCVNNTKGRSCESCQDGFYRARVADACKACRCDLQGSQTRQCDDLGRCQCRPGFEGLRCQRSNCPACFSPIKAKMETYAVKVQELEDLFSDMDGDLRPANNAELEAALRSTEELVDDLQDDVEALDGLEKSLQGRLDSISTRHLAQGLEVVTVGNAAGDVTRQQQTYRSKADDIQTMIRDMKRKLDQAKTGLRAAELPLSDAPLVPDALSSLVQVANSLADKHQTDATAVERKASDALSDSEKGLALVQTLMNRENKVKGLIGDLKTTYDRTSAQVKAQENQAARLSAEAKGESKKAAAMLKDLGDMEQSLPSALKVQDGVNAMFSRLGSLSDGADSDISGFQALQDGVQRDMAAAGDLLASGRTAQQGFGKLLDRVYVAKGIADGALERIQTNTNELDDALRTLSGFDQQIDSSKALADAAIRRLPRINGTVQNAVRSNGETLSLLGDVSRNYDNALETIGTLEGLVIGMEGTFGTLPPHNSLLNQATKLNQDSVALKTRTAGVAGNLASGLDAARKLQATAEQAAAGAAAAFTNAQQTRTTVRDTLRDVNALLLNLNQPGGAVDEGRLKQLEDSLASAQRNVETNLRPRFRDMEEREDAQRRRLAGINSDIDTILADIANLEDIVKKVPEGCYNSQPIEQAL